MPLKSYLIGPQQEGLENDIKPFFIPEDAYFNLEDAYVWRGRIRKRFGYSLIGGTDLNSRFRINVGTTNGAGVLAIVIAAATIPFSTYAIGQIFSLGTEVFTIDDITPGLNDLLDTGTATLNQFDASNGTLNITNILSPNTDVFFYPSLPVMGLLLREEATLNKETVIGFDSRFSYTFNGTSWSRLDTGALALWTGSNSQFFWSCNYRGSLPSITNFYVTNYVRADGIRYMVQSTSVWVQLTPQLDSGATRFLQSCRILLPFKDRLVAFNTLEIEGATDRTYFNRCRYSQNGDPIAIATSWLDDVSGRGGFVDAPTSEQIITAKFIKDHLVVYFERSTWELIYTGNQAFPFRWQQINSELGCESTFSVVGFDTAVLGIGNVGVHDCNGVNVVRIDEKIPDEVFNIHNGNDGPERVYGIRDYFNELVYWTFPDATNNPTFPTRVLLYNYRNSTWAFFNDSFTCFGYYQKLSDLTWATIPTKYPTWADWNVPWGSPLNQAAFPDIIVGNQQGFVSIINNDLAKNAQSLYIANMDAATQVITSINHNLVVGNFILIEEAVGITTIVDNIVVPINGIVFQVIAPITTNIFKIDAIFAGSYDGGGKITRISNIGIKTKQFNPGTPIGQQTKFAYVDFLIDRTPNGEVTLEYLIDTDSASIFGDDLDPGTLLGDSRLFTKPETNQIGQPKQQQIWHRYYVQAQSSFIQLFIFMNVDQMKDLTMSQQPFTLHAFIIYVAPTGRLIG